MIKKLKKIAFNKKRKGSATLEATLIFPLIMFILFSIVYLTIVHYQNNVMIAESVRAMNRAGAYWQYDDIDGYGKVISADSEKTPLVFDSEVPSDGIININMIKNRSPYRTIKDVLAEGFTKIGFTELLGQPLGNKKDKIKQFVNSRIAGVQFKQYIKKEITADKVEGKGLMFACDDLSVEVGRQYINPLQGLAKFFLGDDSVIEKMNQKNITASSVISNQAEFIRNIDTVYEIGISIYSQFKQHKDD